MRFLATGIHSLFCDRKVLVEDALLADQASAASAGFEWPSRKLLPKRGALQRRGPSALKLPGLRRVAWGGAPASAAR